MVVHSFFLSCLAHASYLITDSRSKTAVVIDPQRDVDIYFQKAKELGVEIKHVLLTHFHADFISGHLEIRKRSGAEICLGVGAGVVEYEHTGLADGDSIAFGDVRIVAMETPGHTPESVCYLLYESAAEPTVPSAVFTGDTLFVGDVGRPDLLASIGVTADELATMLYHSLHDKLLQLPDQTVVYPAHGAGSLCGKSLGTERSTTIGQQKRDNDSVQPMPVAEFVSRVTADQPQTPKYFGYDAMLNRKQRGVLEVAVQNGMRPLSAAKFLELRAQGAQVIDTRESDDFANCSVRDAIHVPLSGSFATWSGAMLEIDKPVLVVADPGKHEEAVLRLGRIGMDAVAGYLDIEVTALPNGSDVVQSSGIMDVADLRQRLGRGELIRVLDVRSPVEFEDGHIEGAQHLSLIQLPDRVAEVPRDCEVVVICRTGARSSTAISMLMRAGLRGLSNVRGGMVRWSEHLASTTS